MGVCKRRIPTIWSCIMARLIFLAAVALALSSTTVAFPSYGSLAGLSEAELDRIIPLLEPRNAGPPPGPLKNTSTKLVNDKKHPWKPLRYGDIRGPCPGLNTLASHGVSADTHGCVSSALLSLIVPFVQWLPRDGIATPAQIVNAVQEGSLLD